MSSSSKTSSNRKRRSASAAAGSQGQLMGWGAHPPMFYQWPSSQASPSQGGPMFAPVPPTPMALAPWASDMDSDSDFESPKKNKKLKTEAAQGKRRGRPTKEETKAKEEKAKLASFVAALPDVPPGHDTIMFNGPGACKGCQIYAGRMALKPCGHAKFCFACVQKLREDAEKLGQYSKCPVDNCYSLAKDWVNLFNVSA